MAAGALDTTFDTDGKQSIDFHQRADQALGVATQVDGKVIAAGWTQVDDTPGGRDWAIVRYTATGALDTTFNGTGSRQIDFFGREDEAQFVLVQPDQKVVVVGKSFDPARGTPVTIVRLNADGSFDNSFGTNGIATVFPANGSFSAYAATLDANSRIVIAGNTAQVVDGVNQVDFGVARVTNAGVVDTSFGGGDGVSSAALSISTDIAKAVTVAPGGRIVIGGTVSRPATATKYTDFGLAAFNDDGSIDNTFGTNGTTITRFGPEVGATSEINKLAINFDGKVVAAGRAFTYTNSEGNDFALARYNVDGSLDTTFGGDGRVTTRVGGGFDSASAVQIQDDGKLVVGGTAGSGNENGEMDFALARYNDDGSLDATFGTNGVTISNFNASINAANRDRIFALDLADDGSIVVAGEAQTNPLIPATFNFAVARYTNDTFQTIHLRGDATAIGKNDAFRIVRNGSKLDFYINNTTSTPNFSNPADHTGAIIVEGFGGNDTLTFSGQANNGGGTVFAPTFLGGGGHDSVLVPAGATYSMFYDSQINSADLNLDVALGGNVQVFAKQHIGSLNLAGNLKINGDDRPMVMKNLTLADTGVLDVTTNSLIVDYSGSASPRDGVQSSITFARNDGAWDRAGITSSFLRNGVPANRSLGVLESSEYFASSGATTFAGEALDDTAVLVKCTYFGDVDFNGQVDGTDYNIIDFGFLTGRSGWANGDVDGNGQVDGTDYNSIDFAFLTQDRVL